MADGLLLCAALACSFIGMAWLALAIRVHWRQVRGEDRLSPAAARRLRAAGAAMLLAALLLCLLADHVSMAALVWVMALTASILLVALTLAWRARWLAWLAVWVRTKPTPAAQL